MNNKNKTIFPLLAILATIIAMGAIQIVQAKMANYASGAYLTYANGTKEYKCFRDCGNTDTASVSKADSAAGATSTNNVKCFAFCLGVSTANAGSAANSESRTNSPSATSAAVTTPAVKKHDQFVPPDTVESLAKLKQPVGTECIDNTGSVNSYVSNGITPICKMSFILLP